MGARRSRPADGQSPTPPREASVAEQLWKKQPGHRYTAEELERMAKDLGPFTIVEQAPDVMKID